MDLGLKGKRAAVMAASDGLGRATASSLAREGCRVAICSRDKGRVEEAARAIAAEAGSGAEVSGFAVDVGKAGGPESFIEQAARRLGGLDVLVTNKGGPPHGKFGDLDDVAWQRSFDLVVMSYVRAVRAALPHLHRASAAAGGHAGVSGASGSVVAIESTSVKQGIPNLVLSNALRPSIVALSKALSIDQAPVRFNVVLPGSMATERIRDLTRDNAQRLGISFDEAMQRRVADIPLGRIGEPSELADLIAFLASPRAAYITGTALQCDGGVVRAVA